MKKLFCILLVASIMLVGCGKNENSDSNSVATASEASSSVTYSKDDITKEFNVSVDTIDKSFGSANAKVFTLNKTDYGDLTFYIFNNAEDANTAFDVIKSTLVADDLEDKTTYMIGRPNDVINIVLKKFYYKTSNMIIETEDYCSDPGNLINESEYSIKQNAERHEKIMKKW